MYNCTQNLDSSLIFLKSLVSFLGKVLRMPRSFSLSSGVFFYALNRAISSPIAFTKLGDCQKSKAIKIPKLQAIKKNLMPAISCKPALSAPCSLIFPPIFKFEFISNINRKMLLVPCGFSCCIARPKRFKRVSFFRLLIIDNGLIRLAVLAVVRVVFSLWLSLLLLPLPLHQQIAISARLHRASIG